MAPVTLHMRFPVAILFVNSFLIALAAICVLLRLWVRRMKRFALQVNDYAIIVAWASTICSNPTRDSLTICVARFFRPDYHHEFLCVEE